MPIAPVSVSVPVPAAISVSAALLHVLVVPLHSSTACMSAAAAVEAALAFIAAERRAAALFLFLHELFQSLEHGMRLDPRAARTAMRASQHSMAKVSIQHVYIVSSAGPFDQRSISKPQDAQMAVQVTASFILNSF